MNQNLVLAGAILLTCVMLITGCSVQKQTDDSGAYIWKKREKIPGTTDFVRMKYIKESKIWYKDSLVIEERPAVTIFEDIQGKEIVKEFTEYYTFIDLRTQEHYRYKTFSDTATLVHSFVHRDSIVAAGGWNFFGYRYSPFTWGGIPITDTTINGIVFKRIVKDTSYILDNRQLNSVRHIAYARCDTKADVVQIENRLGKEIGCLVVRIDWIDKDNGYVMTLEIEKVSNKLSSEEEKVFEAWKRNAKQNPISRGTNVPKQAQLK